jgi:putative ABC transport system permease protein
VCTGAVLGLGLAWLAVPWLRSIDINPQLTYFMQRIELDSTVLLLSALTALVAGLAAGLLPAWFSRKANLTDSLRSGSRSVTLSPTALRWQQGMVFVQAALSVVVLSAAALVAVSFRNASRIASGYDPANLIVARIQFPPAANHLQRAAFMSAFEDRLRQETAIASFGATSTLPVSDVPSGGRFFIERPDPVSPAEPALLHFRRVSPGYLTAMRIPLLRGRNFDARDDSSGHPVVIVSKAFAERAWPGQDPIGKRIYRASTPVAEETEVVGMVGDVMDAGNRSPPGEAAYVPWARLSNARASIAFSPRGNDAEAITAFRRALRATDPSLAATGIAPLRELAYQADAVPRLQTLLLLTFAIVAVGITALGSYGVMSQLVANREREYALRLIFGAAPSELGRAVFGLLARLAIPGIGVGLAVILSLGGPLRAFVFGVDPRSIAVLSAVSIGMACVTIIASVPSVIRAMRTDVTKTVGAGQ